jgi:hypothetical protein
LAIGWCFLPTPAWATILLFYASCCHWDDRQTQIFFSNKKGGLMNSLAWTGLEPWSSC